jgi:hypothetical protein
MKKCMYDSHFKVVDIFYGVDGTPLRIQLKYGYLIPNPDNHCHPSGSCPLPVMAQHRYNSCGIVRTGIAVHLAHFVCSFIYF